MQAHTVKLYMQSKSGGEVLLVLLATIVKFVKSCKKEKTKRYLTVTTKLCKVVDSLTNS